MLTTVEISQDVLLAAEELAARQNSTTGEVISDLARKSLRRGTSAVAGTRNGFPLLAPAGQVITSELIKTLQADYSFTSFGTRRQKQCALGVVGSRQQRFTVSINPTCT